MNGGSAQRDNLGEATTPYGVIVAHARPLAGASVPGDVLGSARSAPAASSAGDGRWLRPSDVVELEVEGIGVLKPRRGARGQPL